MFLPAGDAAGIERLIQYMTRCPFSLSRLMKISDTGQVIYQSEKQACRAFPDPKGDGMRAGGSPAKLPNPRATRFPGRVHPGFAPDPLLRLVLEQVAWPAKEGGCGRIRRGSSRATP